MISRYKDFSLINVFDIGEMKLYDNTFQDQRIAAFKKFTILWHLTRDNKDTNPGHPPRSFDR